ncbi:hypothetical protein LCGC14_0964280 [marine sediment metagenome]|uniref:Translation initiation factor IF-3 n=1 Tax=marine sediment metagenome TaxID=412755 RepID=A0A0F9NDM5_9ZZZZ
MSLVLLIGEDGEKIGNVSMEEARRIAKEANKNLVLKDAKRSVYRIANIGKLKYEQRQRKKQQKAQRRTHKVKEIKLRLSTDTHDLEVKTKRIREFLKKGLKTKISICFRGRQIVFKEAGLRKMHELINPLVEEKLALVSSAPKFEGRNLVTFLVPIK